MKEGRTFRVWASGGLAVLGGALMVVSGYAVGGLMLNALNIAASDIPKLLSGVEGEVAILAVGALAFLIALGGVTVLLGGMALLTRHRSVGRFLVLLGGGAGFLGLALAFAYALARLGPAAVTGHLLYWLGLALAVVGRKVAKGT